jgi:hypothetical protein
LIKTPESPGLHIEPLSMAMLFTSPYALNLAYHLVHLARVDSGDSDIAAVILTFYCAFNFSGTYLATAMAGKKQGFLMGGLFLMPYVLGVYINGSLIM